MSKTPKQAEATAVAALTPTPGTPTPAQIRDYLSEHPGFLLDHPDLLACMQLPHPIEGHAVSLVTHQIRVLRERSEALQTQVDAQFDAARYNEQLHERLHTLCLALFPATTLEARIDVITAHLRDELGGDAIAVRLFGAPGTLAEDFRADRENLDFQRHFGSFLKSRAPLCGRLQQAQRDYLFADRAETVQSAALTPLGKGGNVGLLAIGSHDPGRFQPHFGTDFLRQLGETIGAALLAAMESVPAS